MQPQSAYETWWHDWTEGIGLATALDARPVYQTATRYHQIEVLAHASLGWVLAIDGRLEAVELDPVEREMLIHVPLLGRRRPGCRVLVLGGGDGAKLHEVLRHAFVTEVVLCEPDSALIEVGVRYLGFGRDLRDGRVQIRELPPQKGEAPFDLVVASGTAGDFRQDLDDWLAPQGVAVACDQVVLGLSRRGWRRNGGAGPAVPDFGVEHYYTVSQLSPGGFTGYFLYTRDRHSYAEPCYDFRGISYNPDLHRAGFALPSFYADLVPGAAR